MQAHKCDFKVSMVIYFHRQFPSFSSLPRAIITTTLQYSAIIYNTCQIDLGSHPSILLFVIMELNRMEKRSLYVLDSSAA